MVEPSKTDSSDKNNSETNRKNLFSAYLLLLLAMLYLAFIFWTKYQSIDESKSKSKSHSYQVCEFGGGEAFRGPELKKLLPFDLKEPLFDKEYLVIKEGAHILLRHTSGTEISITKPSALQLMPGSIDVIDGPLPEIVTPKPGFVLTQKEMKQDY